MTTLVALAAKDALVMGTDSLATITRLLVDPEDLLDYFDSDNDFSLKVDDQGNPLLSRFSIIREQAQAIPYNQLGNVLKLFDLSPHPMGVMFTGVTSIGNQTIGSLVSEFKRSESDSYEGAEPSHCSVRAVGDRLLQVLRGRYESEYPRSFAGPELELILGGYDKHDYLPQINRVNVRANTITEVLSRESPFGVVFGGQTEWIQRIVFGTDENNQIRLVQRSRDLLNDYWQRISVALNNAGIIFEVPPPDFWGDELNLFNNWILQGLEANIADFSEQNAIDCVDFFIEIMIRAQAVSSQMPTVGGDVNIAVIRKDGFQFVSRQELRHGDHSITIPGAHK